MSIITTKLTVFLGISFGLTLQLLGHGWRKGHWFLAWLPSKRFCTDRNSFHLEKNMFFFSLARSNDLSTEKLYGLLSLSIYIIYIYRHIIIQYIQIRVWAKTH
jgi:hypothetical protein